ncbi:MAG: DMT family transporter [Mucinivorans sp.]
MKIGANIGVLISVVLFSLSFIWSKGALEFLSPSMLVMARVTVALITVCSISLALGKFQRLTRRDAMLFAILAAAEPVGYFLFETTGITYVSPTLACIIVAMIPALAPLFAWLINGEKVDLRQWVGLLMGLSGVMLVALADGTDDLSGQLIGILLLFGAVVTSLIYTLMVQRLSARYNSYSIVAWQNIFSILYLIPVILIFDFDRIAVLEFSTQWIYPVLTLGILCSSIAFVLYANGIHRLGVMRTSLYINLMPGMTAVASFFIMDESLPIMKIVGIIVVVAGLYIGLRSHK